MPDIVSVIKMSELYQISLDELLKGDDAMMKKLEKDAERIKFQKKFFQYAWVAVVLGVIVLILDQIFEGNSVIEFTSGALPWMLLGVSFLFTIMYLNREEEIEQNK